MSEDKNGYKKAAIVFIVLFALSILVLIQQNSSANLSYESYKSIIKDYNDHYVYKCAEGTEQRCLSPNQELSYCTATTGYDQFCYDDRLQTAITCNRADGLLANCVPKDSARWANCPEGYTAICKQN